MLNWLSDKKEIVENILSTKTKIKVLLKTYNDPFFLEKWIVHHGNLFGFESLIIADNLSDDEEVLSIYARYPQVMKFSFKEHHNRIHDASVFPELYKAIEESCNHRILIDTDEFIYFYDGVLHSDSSIRDKMLNIPDDSSTPCIWIENRPGCADQFYIGHGINKLVWGGRWGKPIVASSYKPNQSILHSEQFPKDIKWFAHSSGIFILFHFNTLSYEQRIKANIRKLVRAKVFSNDITLAEILEKGSLNIENKTMARFVKEIIEANNSKYSENDGFELSDGFFKINSSGCIDFFNKAAEDEFNGFFKNFEDYLFSDFGALNSKELSKKSK